MTDIQQYLDSLTDTASTGDTREESYYSDLSNLLEEHADENGHDDVQVTTLPSPTDGGNPDFRVWSGTNEVTGYIEAKLPSGQPLDTIEEREQLTRYRNTFENVILTNFVEFRLYRNGEQVAEAEIADPPEIPRFGDAPNAVNTDDFETLFEQFFSFSRPEIESARQGTRGRKDRSRSAEVENYAGSSFSVFKQRFTGVTIRILDGFTLD